MKHRQTYRHALLHGRHLSRHGMARRERVVKEVIIGIGVGGLDVVDKGRESSRVALTQLLGEPLGEVAEGEEDGQRPHRAQEVEEQVAHGGTLGSHIATHRRHERRDGGAYVGAEHQRARQVKTYPALAAHDERDGKRCRARLDDHGEQHAHKREYQHRAEAHRRVLLEKCKHLGIALQVRHISADEVETHKQERKSDEKLAYRLVAAALGKQQRYRQAYHRQYKRRDIDLESKQGYHPCGERGAHIGTHDYGHRLAQRHEAGVDKTYHHYRRGRRALYQGCDEDAGEHACEAVAGHGRKYVAETVARGFLQAFAHHFHTIEEQGYRAE